MELGKKCKATY